MSADLESFDTKKHLGTCDDRTLLGNGGGYPKDWYPKKTIGVFSVYPQ